MFTQRRRGMLLITVDNKQYLFLGNEGNYFILKHVAKKQVI